MATAAAVPGINLGTTNLRSALVVGIAALVMFVANGFIFVGLTVFDPLILDRLGTSVGALKTRDAVTLITAAVLSPLSGYLLDRFGVRPIMATGMIFMAIGMYAYAGVTTLHEIYLIHVLFGCCLVMAGLFVCIVLITGVTSRHRGLAVGIVLAGSSLGQAVSPKLNLMLEASFGWQNALKGGAVLALAMIPIVLVVVPRRRPGPHTTTTLVAGGGLTYAAALRTRSFWLLSTIAMVTFFAQLGLVTNLVLYVEKQLGQSANFASQAVFIVSTASVIFKLCAGPLIDRIGAKRVHLVSILVMGAGLAALALSPPKYLLLSVACVGVGWGGNYAAIQVSTSRLFSGAAIGRILGTVNVIEATGAGLGPPGFGRLYDVTHNYAVAFGIAAALVLLMSIAVSQVAVPQPDQP
jgi:MFS family permease